MPQICIFDRVKLNTGHEGQVKFIGQIETNESIVYGIKLDENIGDNNGSYNCIKYFDCTHNYGLFVTIDKIIDYCSTTLNKSLPRISIHDKVLVKNKSQEGILKFIGTTHFEQGIIYGIELLIPLGDNNGSIHGRQYFKCNDFYGIFCHANNIQLVCQKHAFPISPKTKETLQDIWNSYNTTNNSNKCKKTMSKIYNFLYICITNDIHLVRQMSNIISSYLFGDKYTDKYEYDICNQSIKKQKLDIDETNAIYGPQAKRRRLTITDENQSMEQSSDTDDDMEDIYGPYGSRNTIRQNIPSCMLNLLNCNEQKQINLQCNAGINMQKNKMNNNPYCDGNLFAAIETYSPIANKQFIKRHSIDNINKLCRDKRTSQHNKYWQIGSKNEYKMEMWARNNYQIELHKKGLFAIKHQNIYDILSYIEFNKMKNPLNIKANCMKEQCMQIWKNINSYMGLRKSRKSSHGHVDKLLCYALNGCDILRDEMYCQIIKQVTKNPKLSSVIQGYKLLLICCSFFIPSKQFINYLACFLWNNTYQSKEVGMYAIKALHALDNTVINGIAKTIPCVSQILKLEKLED